MPRLTPMESHMAEPNAADLHRDVAALRQRVERGGHDIFQAWRRHLKARRVTAGARNLADYLALRAADVAAMQPHLAARGLSSLGRSEAHVQASIAALEATLARLAGVADPPPYPSPARFAAGRRTLSRSQQELFGPAPDGGRTGTRIMVTLPSEAATDTTLADALVAAGMSSARINCAHDDAGAWRAMAAQVRRAAAAAGRECRILMDIGGPKCRIETVHAAGKVRLFTGDRFVLARSLAEARSTDAVVATIAFPHLVDLLQPGAEIWINDGRIGARVTECAAGRAVLEVTAARAKGERLKPEKGINFPGMEMGLDPITQEDLADLDAVAELADLVGFSFVQRPEDIARLDAELAARRPGRPPLPLLLKIETQHAVENLPALIVAAGARGPVAVMIARGDLAVELGFSRLSEMQEEILWICEAAHVPVVWATQVLDGLVSDGIPTRAEATDAAMAQRAECVMLNKGPHVVAAVEFLADVLGRMARHQSKKTARLPVLRSWLPGPENPSEA
jgi:pyruvate kinase